MSKEQNAKLEGLLKEFPELNDGDIIHIKGTSVSQLYPSKYERYQADVDLIVKNIDAVWEILRQTQTSYQYDYLKIYSFCNSQKFFSASIDLESRLGTNLPDIDIHVAPFYIWGNTYLDVDLWEKNKFVNGINIPSINNMCILLIAHIAKQWKFRMRDINDLYILITQEEFNFEKFNNILEQQNLKNIFSILYTKLVSVYGNVLNIKIRPFSPIFYINNYGTENYWSATKLELNFTYFSYIKKETFFTALKEALKNTYFMIRHKNRAFNIKYKGKKGWKKNTIITLKPTEEKIDVYSVNSKSIGKKMEMVVIADIERYKTPLGIWQQCDYYGKEGY